ncbi:aspartate 1-decarboxylase [Paenibacillus xylanexedens]|uniref:aspartate 1-decarboxylase n=1 Tax=Paenibacillus xylanexedens TaxID=528191 RepID=UPI0009381C1E|nr:aspartate 1-decarboxylase [Paenibacillus xylanexedens]APO47199.1 aspartate 1-decarboxylase [Paenibacillus xylanexedens]
MFRLMHKSKIHRATVTEACLHYVGSITIDEELMEQANIVENEKVLVVNINNGLRFETYTISGPRGSGVICINGAAARMAQVDDKVIVISFGIYNDSELDNFMPKVVIVDDQNKAIVDAVAR